MAFQLGAVARSTMLDGFESAAGTTAKLLLRSGSVPANCGTADAGTLLATLTLPSDWMQAGSAGAKLKSAAAWTGTVAVAGTAAHFRVWDNGLAVCHAQGTVGLGSGDLSLDNNVLGVGQTITIGTFTLTAGNA